MLIIKIRSVKRVYRQLAIHSSLFRKSSKLQCISGCSACCAKPDIEATILEFLPAAYASYMDGSYLQLIENIERVQNAGDSTCAFYQPLNGNGGCMNYVNRGMICRLFGFSSKLDKTENRELLSCRFIKEIVNPSDLQASIDKAPDMSAYYMKLFGIDPKLSIQYYPINEAIMKALEMVLMHFHYRKKPA
jgi:Fe-S-cluster containining protein